MWASDLGRRGSDAPTPRTPTTQRNQSFPHHIPLEQVRMFNRLSAFSIFMECLQVIDDAPALKEKIYQQEEVGSSCPD
jgi:hypothetical protein